MCKQNHAMPIAMKGKARAPCDLLRKVAIKDEAMKATLHKCCR